MQIPPAGTRGQGFPPVARFLFGSLLGLFNALYPLLSGRMRVQNLDLTMITTKGARTGKTRKTVVGYVTDGDGRWIVIASNAGSARHPGWFFNMARNPDDVRMRVGSDEWRVKPELLVGAERQAAWNRVVAIGPGYGEYERKTDRQIPVVRLTRV